MNAQERRIMRQVKTEMDKANRKAKSDFEREMRRMSRKFR